MKVAVRLFAAILTLSAGSALAADTIEPHPLDQVLGKPDAKVTIVEYASTTCGHCATLHTGVLPKIKADWIDSGKARLIFRDFPTGPAALSLAASMIPHCAGGERYFGVLGLIMQQQEKWMGSQNPLDELKKTVRLAGITGDQVDACLQRRDLLQGLQERAKAGHEKWEIDSTPTMLINGEKIVGAQPYDVYDKALKAAAK